MTLVLLLAMSWLQKIWQSHPVLSVLLLFMILVFSPENYFLLWGLKYLHLAGCRLLRMMASAVGVVLVVLLVEHPFGAKEFACALLIITANIIEPLMIAHRHL